MIYFGLIIISTIRLKTRGHLPEAGVAVTGGASRVQVDLALGQGAGLAPVLEDVGGVGGGAAAGGHHPLGKCSITHPELQSCYE